MLNNSFFITIFITPRGANTGDVMQRLTAGKSFLNTCLLRVKQVKVLSNKLAAQSALKGTVHVMLQQKLNLHLQEIKKKQKTER